MSLNGITDLLNDSSLRFNELRNNLLSDPHSHVGEYALVQRLQVDFLLRWRACSAIIVEFDKAGEKMRDDFGY